MMDLYSTCNFFSVSYLLLGDFELLTFKMVMPDPLSNLMNDRLVAGSLKVFLINGDTDN